MGLGVRAQKFLREQVLPPRARPHRSTPPSPYWGRGHFRDYNSENGLATEDHFVETPDGYHVFLKRIYRPDLAGGEFRVKRDACRGAIIAEPGSWENGNLWRIHFDGNLLYEGELNDLNCWANYFADQGYDFYAVHLFGPRVYERYVKRKVLDPNLKAVPRERVNFDDIVRRDVGRIIDYVQRTSGDVPIFWLGHSAGGMLGFAYLGSYLDDQRIKKAVSVAGPVRLGAGGNLGHEEARSQQRILRLLRASDTVFSGIGFVERHFHPHHLMNEHLVGITDWAGRVPPLAARLSLFNGFLFNYPNVDPGVIGPFVRKVAEPIPPQFLNFLHGMLHTGGFAVLNADGEVVFDYLAGMRKIRIPVMLVGGMKDEVAAPANMQLTYEMLVNSDGRQILWVADAGHLDLIAGKTALDTMQRVDAFLR